MTRWSNRAIERARGRWILVLDADEVLDPDSAPKIENLIGRVTKLSTLQFCPEADA
jgi:glycosyltransferase involved in cell wall biosynthesis